MGIAVPSRVYDDMTWEEVANEASAQTPVVIPIGATEQHGPHLPVSTDWVLPSEILRRASAARRVLAGPAVTFGYRSRPSSGGGQGFPGTVSLRATTLIALIEDILSELVRAGFKNLVIYNWHFENTNFVYESAYLCSAMHPDVKIVVIENAMPEFSAEEVGVLWPNGFPGLALEHAAILETSLWLHHRPSMVRSHRMRADSPERHVPYDVVPIDQRMTTSSGSLSSPLDSTAEKGKLLMDRIVNHLLTILDAEFPGINGPAETNSQR